jgi:DNA-binding CsgD family transcriptional regulator
MATEGTDEDVAEELEWSACRAQARGGLAAAAAFLEWAAMLTPDPARRTRRALAGARAKVQAGEFDAALDLLAIAESGPLGEEEKAHVMLVRAQFAFTTNKGGEVPALLMEAARALEPFDAGLARMTHLDAIHAAIFAGRLAAPDADILAAAHVAQAAPALPAESAEAEQADRLLEGLAARFHGVDTPLPQVLTAMRGIGDPCAYSARTVRWLSLAGMAASGAWDYQRWEQVTDRYEGLCRELGAIAELRLALTSRAFLLIFAGELAAAASVAEELQAAMSATGSSLVSYGALALAAFRGRESEATAMAAAMAGDGSRRGEGFRITVAEWARAVLGNGFGHYHKALAAAQRAAAYPRELTVRSWALAELVEAAMRSGDTRAAADAHRQLAELAQASGTDWALGVAARSHALLAEGEEAEARYQESIALLSRTRVRSELARAHLLYGEWLRRERRRGEARAQLREAHEMLQEMGMVAFAERAGRELWATGETARKRTAEGPGELTAQEYEIAKLAREGLSNPEIGTRLFISARTVEYHLGKVFIKLAITSRGHLDRALS